MDWRNPAAIRVAEARALQAVQLAQAQAEARLLWQRRAEESLQRRPTSAARRLRAHQRFMAEIQRPVSPSTPRQRAIILPFPRPLHDGENVLRQTRHDVSNPYHGRIINKIAFTFRFSISFI